MNIHETHTHTHKSNFKTLSERREEGARLSQADVAKAKSERCDAGTVQAAW